MSSKAKFTIIACCVAALFSLVGLYRLVELRLDSGDVFPDSSSLRSDPMGCKALYQALGRCGIGSARNYRELKKLKGEEGTTLYWLAADETLLEKGSDEQAKALQALALQGERVVIALGRERKRPPAGSSQSCAQEPAKVTAKGPSKESKESKESTESTESAKGAAAPKSAANAVGAWGIVLTTAEAPAAREKRPTAALSDAASALPPTIPFTVNRHLLSTTPLWHPVYQQRGEAVVLERTVGKGSIVLLADAYLVSNEALRNDRYPGFISWLQGNNRTALFDEAHLGVYDSPGMMTLVRKHRLVPFLLALLALSALYVWKHAVPFAAARQPEAEQVAGEKRDHFSGLVNLLRRNIAAHELMSTCFRQWHQSFSRELKHLPELAGELQKVLDEEKNGPAASRDPVLLYRRMTGLLAFFRMK